MNAWYMLAAYVGAILICLALCAASLAVMMHGIVKARGKAGFSHCGGRGNCGGSAVH